tara:strand:+ start:130 stop:612 length:483 start_codon:yes stop_codon:yes gene_type:complete
MAQHENAREYSTLTENQIKFLRAFEVCGVISEAARRAEVDRTRHYEWLKNSEDYRECFTHAKAACGERIIAKCRHMALEEDSVPMLIHLSKGYFPEMFGTKRHEISGPGGGPIQNQALSGSTSRLQERLHALRERCEQSGSSTDLRNLLDRRGEWLADSD